MFFLPGSDVRRFRKILCAKLLRNRSCIAWTDVTSELTDTCLDLGIFGGAWLQTSMSCVS